MRVIEITLNDGSVQVITNVREVSASFNSTIELTVYFNEYEAIDFVTGEIKDFTTY